MSSSARNQRDNGINYDYFQLYDLDDSDLESETDPDVKSLLINAYKTTTKNVGTSNKLKTCKKCCNVTTSCTKTQISLIMGGLVLILVSIGLGLGFGLARDLPTVSWTPVDAEATKSSVNEEEMPPSVLGTYRNAAISIDGEPCAEIGMNVLRRNGSAVDSAIAALFCNGLINPHSMGIGGGFLMTIYIKETGETIALNARETAPAKSTVHMFHGDPDKSQNGPLASGIPGEILGYWRAKLRFGNPSVTWESLIEPSIKMCKEGIQVTNSLAKALEEQKERIFLDPGLRGTFINPQTNDTWKEGDYHKREMLAKTLEKIAQNYEDFYKGKIAQNLVKDIQKDGGIITLDDLKDYRVQWTDALTTKINQHEIHSVPPPGSGSILEYIVNILQHFNQTKEDESPLLHHRIAEAFKWGYAVRSRLGDPADEAIREEVLQLTKNMTSEAWGRSAFLKINDDYTVNDPSYYGGDFFVPEDHGTAHVSILAPNGDAVSATSTVNLYFGCRYMSPSTGIILNSEMDDFSFPGFKNYFGLSPSEANFVKPGKRPLSSMSPAIITDSNGDVEMVIGAAGGSKITTAIAYTIVRSLWIRNDLKEAIDARRIHHQLLPMEVAYEDGVSSDITEGLASRGHKLKKFNVGGSVVCAILRAPNGTIFANADFRKSGGVAGF